MNPGVRYLKERMLPPMTFLPMADLRVSGLDPRLQSLVHSQKGAEGHRMVASRVPMWALLFDMPSYNLKRLRPAVQAALHIQGILLEMYNIGGSALNRIAAGAELHCLR